VADLQLFSFSDAAFFDGRCAVVTLEGNEIGVLGVLHPNVLNNFSLNFPASVLELNVEMLLQYYLKHENE
jgi:phenylalanyl-tRNA synthetase beta chain